MPIRTKVNHPNDFLMSIIDFPPSMDDFDALRFPAVANVWVTNSKQQIDIFANQNLRDFGDLQSFVKAQIENRQIKFIKVHPRNEPYNENYSHYICFGDDPDGLENSISFRIDQNWDNFLFPQNFGEESIEYLKSIVGLSGTVIGRLDFPEIMLSKEWIGNPKICYGYDGKGNIVNSEAIQKAISNYLVLARDYWGVATTLDKLGFVWLWNTRNQKDFEIKQTGLSLKEWFQAELQNPFRQRREPEWLRQKTA